MIHVFLFMKNRFLLETWSCPVIAARPPVAKTFPCPLLLQYKSLLACPTRPPPSEDSRPSPPPELTSVLWCFFSIFVLFTNAMRRGVLQTCFRHFRQPPPTPGRPITAAFAGRQWRPRPWTPPPSTSAHVHRLLRHAVVHGARGERQTAVGTEPADVGTQDGRRGHVLPPVQPAAVHHVRRRAGRRTARRGVRRPTRAAARTPGHGQGGQRQQHSVQRGHDAAATGSGGAQRPAAGQQAGHVEKVSNK